MPIIQGSERLVVIVGPSGAGKDSVMASWRERLHGAPVHFAQRAITRAAEDSEAHEALTSLDFERAAARGEFVTWWAANGLQYAVRWEELRPLQTSHWVVVNGSRAHLSALRRQAPNLKSVEITANPRTRACRLQARGRERGQAIVDRLHRDVAVRVDLHVSNDSALSVAVDQLHAWWRQMSDRDSRQRTGPQTIGKPCETMR